MHLLYLDESGTHTRSSHLVVGGVAVFERSAYWVQQDLNQVVRRFFPGTDAAVEIHASPLRVPKGESARPPYDGLTAPERRQMLLESY